LTLELTQHSFDLLHVLAGYAREQRVRDGAIGRLVLRENCAIWEALELGYRRWLLSHFEGSS
jgi:hypothetical protein